jgi:Penicillin amidase
VLLGRDRDYAWSATSAGQDIIDTFAVPLCEPDGSKPTIDSMHYRFHGQCLPIDVLEKTNSWTPSLADDTPPGSEKLHAERTNLGLVTARANVRGKPVAYTKLRSTYFHEADSALGFVTLNDPSKIKGPRTSSEPPRRSASPSTGSTRTTRTSRTSTSATTPCAPRGRAPTSR